MGPEPYSLAIILREAMGNMLFRNVKILATDIDHSDLFGAVISQGEYAEEIVKRIPGNILDTHFTEDSDTKKWKLSEEIRKSVEFQRHDLLSLVPPVDKVGLVVCKNVLLHFSQPERLEVLRMFLNSLDDGGFLAMEQTQVLPDELSRYFVPVRERARVYRKVA